MRVHPTFQIPSNAALLSGTCVTVSTVPLGYRYPTDAKEIYGVIFIGSTTAFSSMVNAAIVFQQTSCIIPQAIVLLRGRNRVLPERYFNLGIFGVPINAIAVAWVLFLDVLYCFPTSMPVTPQNMSYVSVVSVGLITFVVVLWFLNKRNTFKGPKVDYNLLNMRRMANSSGEESTLDATNLETGNVTSQEIGKKVSNREL
jgi:choline transport protein